MYQIARKPVAVALTLMMLLLLGSVAAEAHDNKGSDRLVKGAVLGAAVGAVTQAARGRRSGTQILKGAGVGAAVGAAVGAYSDYRQEKRSVRDHHRDDYYQSHRGYRAYDRYDDRYGRSYRANRANHRHNRRCGHLR